MKKVRNKLPKLSFDSLLFQMAGFHSLDMLFNERVSHDEDFSLTRNYTDRQKFFLPFVLIPGEGFEQFYNENLS
jgi:hypothetical protein